MWKDHFVDTVGPILSTSKWWWRVNDDTGGRGKMCPKVNPLPVVLPQLPPTMVCAGKPVSVIDVAGGTGDIAFRLADGMRRSRVRTPVAPEIVVTDINEGMLNVGQERAKRLGYASGECVGVRLCVG